MDLVAVNSRDMLVGGRLITMTLGRDLMQDIGHGLGM